MATGAYDANGIWQYGEGDNIALFSDLLNLGQESTSDAFTDDRARIAFLEQSVEQASTFVASSAAARNSYWGVPANATEQLALQNKGARTVRTDLGYTEQYFAAYNASTNPGGRVEGAGWTPIRRQDGLVPIAPTSVSVASGTGSVNPLGQFVFSNATAISLNGVFTSQFKNYKVVMNIRNNATTTEDMPIRLRNGGTDNASGYYGTGYDTTTNASTTTGTSYGYYNISYGVPARNTPSSAGVVFDILNPAVNSTTEIMSRGLALNGSTAAYYSRSHFISHNVTGGFDGFTLWQFANNFYGTIQVFGYND